MYLTAVIKYPNLLFSFVMEESTPESAVQTLVQLLVGLIGNYNHVKSANLQVPCLIFKVTRDTEAEGFHCWHWTCGGMTQRS